MNAPATSPHFRKTLLACVLTAAVETVLVLTMTAPMVLILALGPFLFLPLIAWRRRTHTPRGRRIQAVTMGISAFGIAALAVSYLTLDPDRAPIAPLVVPLVQWVAVLYVWIGIVREESREKKEKSRESG
jgi:hypothetical protein